MSLITNPETIFRAVNPDGSLESYTEQNDNLYSVSSCGQTIAGGFNNSITGDFNTIGGGIGNSITPSDGSNTPLEVEASVIAGGQYNVSAQSYSVIGGGCTNTNYGYASTIGGGAYNYIKTSAPFAFIGGGYGNLICRDFSIILGGCCNLVGGGTIGNSTIIGGSFNCSCGSLSTILGSFNSTIHSCGGTRGGGGSNVIIGGTLNMITGLLISNSFIIGPGGSSINNANGSIIIGGNSNILSGHHYAAIISDGRYREEIFPTNSSGPNTLTLDFLSGTYIKNTIIFQNDNYAPSNHTSFGISGQISYDKNYLYRHNGDHWTKVQMGTGDNLFLTGSILATSNSNYNINYSGWANNTYATVSNLFSTGSVLATYNTNYSGWAKNTYATADNLFLTGSNIVATRITGVSIQDEGSSLAQAKTLNFVGAGVSASVANAIATITIAGGGGGGNVSYVSVPTTPNSAGSNGQIATDSRYFYSHNGSKWRRTALAEW